MNPGKQVIYLGALLHDIGKFYQRADENGTVKSTFLHQDIKNLESVLCPVYNGRYSHKHVLWTAQFFADHKSLLTAVLSTEGGFTNDGLLRLAASHHHPDNHNLYEKIIQKADHYSSGIDRSSDTSAWKDAEEESDQSWDQFKKTLMRSIFEGVALQIEAGTPWTTAYSNKLPLDKITLDESYFPAPEITYTTDYLSLWKQFNAEIETINSKNGKAFTETLLSLLEKYTSRIPSSTQHLPDVSLYDHAKMTAAFAVCLFDYCRHHEITALPTAETEPFLLIGGDLSGIQKYIYNIVARGAAKNLKGRSFYLHLLTDNLVKMICEKLELTDSQVVYASGGGFYLLAPNIPSVREGLIQLESEISALLFRQHHGELFLALDAVDFGEQQLFFKSTNTGQSEKESIGEIWASLNERLSRKKSQRFIDLLRNNYELFFEPRQINALGNKDAITGEPIEGNPVRLDENNPNLLVNESTYQQIRLGLQLKDTDFWVTSREVVPYFDDPFRASSLPMVNYFMNQSSLAKKASKLQLSADRIHVKTINSADFLQNEIKGNENSYGFTFYGGNRYPLAKNSFRAKTFEELCGIEFEDEACTLRRTAPDLVRLGVLRMDVDNLGSIFKRGLSPDKRSFSRYSTLSRSLDYFFKGFLNTIWEKTEDYRNYTQIIYSGGDDLFIVGKWDVLISLAQEINKKFRAWTCYNPCFSLSGGLAIVQAKFPILKASGMSETEEKRAKLHRYNTIEKNAFSLFGYAFNWDHEFPYLVELKNEILDLLKIKDGLASGFPSSLYNLMLQAGFKIPEKGNKYQLQNYQVVWLIAYQFKRATQRIKGDQAKAFLNTWTHSIFTGRIEKLAETIYHPLQLLAIAARWASFENRSSLKS